MRNGIKHKLLNFESCQVKVHATGNGPTQFNGYASVFGGIDSYGDTIEPGAYSNTLEMRDRPVRMRWNHFGPIIGKWIEIKEDDKGLHVRGELTPGHTTARNVGASMRHGAVDGLSIGYRVVDSEKNGDVQILTEIELVEISVVEEPADLAAMVSEVKSCIEKATTLKELESILRDAGQFSKSGAEAFISRVKECLGDPGHTKKEPVTLKESDIKALIENSFKGLYDGLIER